VRYDGEVWKISGRKGNLTIKLLNAVDETKDNFFDAEIMDGNVQYIGIDNNLSQKLDGMGTPGAIETFRTSLVHWKEKIA